MMDMMSTALGRKWWFAGTLGFLCPLLTLPLMRAAGWQSPQDWAQWLVYILCIVGAWRGLGFVAWLAVLLIAPTSTLLDPPKR